MKIKEAISRADAVRPNTIGEEQKAAWLYELDGKLMDIMGKSGPVPLAAEEKNDGPDVPLERWPADHTLRMPPPYDNIYELYLCAMIDNANEETALYENDMVVFNAAYKEAIAWWRRHHYPEGPQQWRTM